MAENKVAQILSGVAGVMRAEFNKSAVLRHRGEKGRVREVVVVHDFFEKYLPGNVRVVHSGEIITCTGEVSPQCDIIIHDRSAPPMLDAESYHIVPNECVYGVVEVKSKLDSGELRDACEKIRAVKALPKTAFEQSSFGMSRTVYGQTYNYVPTVGIIFAYDSIDLLALKQTLTEWAKDYPAAEIPDSIWVLNRGYLQWVSPVNGRIDPSPSPGAGVAVLSAPEIGDVLFPLMFHLGLHFSTAWMKPIRLADYAGDAPLGNYIGGDRPDYGQ